MPTNGPPPRHTKNVPTPSAPPSKRNVPPATGDPGARLSAALDHLNACAWSPEDRRALRAAREACADLRGRVAELEEVDRSFPGQIRRFFDSVEGRHMREDRMRSAWTVVWNRLATIHPEDRAGFIDLARLLTPAIQGNDVEEITSICKGMLEVLRNDPVRAMTMDLGDDGEDAS